MHSVTLGAGNAPKAAVKIPALHKVHDSLVPVELVERGDGAIENVRVKLADCVPCEYTDSR